LHSSAFIYLLFIFEEFLREGAFSLESFIVFPDRLKIVENPFTLIIPVHDEEKIIEENILKIRDYANQFSSEKETLICENGSTDSTLKIAEDLAKRYDDVRLLSLPYPSLPAALKRGIRASRFERLVYFPIDLSVNLSFIEESLRLLNNYDMVLGSKRMRGAVDDRPLERQVLSKGYHFLVRVLFNMDLSDTTCVKAFRRSRIIELLDQVPASSSVFETRLVAEALKRGFKITEIPVKVKDHRRSRRVLRRAGAKLIDILSSRLARSDE